MLHHRHKYFKFQNELHKTNIHIELPLELIPDIFDFSLHTTCLSAGAPCSIEFFTVMFFEF